ncbi:hypothetical protein SUGI_0379340 [Cryptomeria japonica]|nr:hypothetical protein SUGI_0379340 [Cryptomeria japonica]
MSFLNSEIRAPSPFIGYHSSDLYTGTCAPCIMAELGIRDLQKENAQLEACVERIRKEISDYESLKAMRLENEDLRRTLEALNQHLSVFDTINLYPENHKALVDLAVKAYLARTVGKIQTKSDLLQEKDKHP